MKVSKTALDGVIIIEPQLFSDARGTFCETFSERDFNAAAASTDGAPERDFAQPALPAGNEHSPCTQTITHGNEASSDGKDCSCGTQPTVPVRFVQDNQSTSRRGVVRGLHFQQPPHSQAKLVRVVAGSILDVAVDMRKSSPTFGQHVRVELSAENRRQLFIPHGFAHGFSVLSDEAVLIYKVDDYYAPECDGGVVWNDPALGIDWGTEFGFDPTQAIVSEKDSSLPRFENAFAF
jgi:dTDP-4-dehydrorhamnose 3,5-epimerase